MLRTYFRMKKNEWKLKGIIYGAINTIFDEKKNIIDAAHKLYTVLKDTPVEELHTELINKLAEIMCEENKSE